MQNDRGWQNIQRMLDIEWGKLAGDEPVSLSDRQREDDRKRALPFRAVYITVTDYPDCDWCKMAMPPANYSQLDRGLCPMCEIEEGE